VVSTCRHTHHALVALADTDHDWIGLKALGACVATETELVVRACSGSEHAFAMLREKRLGWASFVTDFGPRSTAGLPWSTRM
jgi:hypothetical protein